MFVLTHKIAGITFRTESDVEIIPIQNDFFQQFLTDDSKPDVYHRICGIDCDTLTLPPLSEREKERISRCVSLPHIGRGTLTLPPLISGKEKERISGCVSLPRGGLNVPLLQSPSVRARLESCLSHPEQVGLTLHIFSVVIHDYVHRTVDIFYPSERHEIFKGHWVENGFQRMFTSFLPTFSAVMVHSSGFIRDGAAALFLAPDEGGKTTVVKHATAGTILCDDRNILRQEGDVVMAHSTPWGMLTNGPQRARVGGFFLLEKASDFELIPIKPRDVLQFLWNEHMHFWRVLPRKLRIQAFEILHDVCYQAPVYLMRFPEDYVDWDAIDAAMVR